MKTSIISMIVPYMLLGACSTNQQATPTVAKSADVCTDQPSQPLNNQNVQTVSLSEKVTTISGIVNQNKQVAYVFDAKAGQTLRYQTKDDICAWLYTPDNKLLSSGQLPSDGKYIVQVTTLSGSKTFNLEMNLESPQSQMKESASAQPSPNLSSSTLSSDRGSSSPETFVSSYYSKINQRNYRAAWETLSSDFQGISGSFADYTDWWNKVDRVQVGSERLLSKDGNQVVIEARLQYVLKSGRRFAEQGNFYLDWNPTRDHWELVKVTKL